MPYCIYKMGFKAINFMCVLLLFCLGAEIIRKYSNYSMWGGGA